MPKKKAAKSTKKYAASGQLKKEIEARRKHQQVKKRVQGRRGAKNGKAKSDPVNDDDDPEDAPKKAGKSTKVDDFLSGKFMDSPMDDDDEEDEGLGVHDESSDDEDDMSGEDDFASVDDLDEEGEAHLFELSKLAEKDPEFYKYLQENDRELLEFNPDSALHATSDDDGDDGDEDHHSSEQGRLPVLTRQILNKWQKSLLEQRSLRALRKLLIAFRSAAHMNEDGQALAWSIDNSSIYHKLVVTSLKYTPVVLEHHVPYKTLPNGKLKPPTQTHKFKTLQKFILSYFYNIIHIISQLTDNELTQLAVTESAKIIPYIVSSRKAVRLYLKKCLDLWSSASDSIRIAAFLAIRKLASTTDDSIMDLVLKGTYLTLVRTAKSTSAFTLPFVNLMKNSASEIYCMNHAMAYQHAFGYIRQLAIHLRNSMKVKTKEAYKQVYNWQYAHCVDFWAIVLARACGVHTETENNGQKSELEPLVYPLVQVSFGAIKLIANARSFPFHLQIIRSLMHLTRRVEVYIPIPPYLFPILTSTLSSSRPKPSTLRPLDLELQVRAPQQYLKTRVYTEGLVEETVYLLAEWLASKGVLGSIAFLEIVVPVLDVLRKTLKNIAKNVSSLGRKEVDAVGDLVKRIGETVEWFAADRNGFSLAPGKMKEVDKWEAEIKAKVEESPLGKYVKVQRKTREKRRNLLEKAREGEDEILED